MRKLSLVSAIQKTTLVGPILGPAGGGPGPGPGPVLLCPYVMDSQDLSATLGTGQFAQFAYADGVAVGSVPPSSDVGTRGAFASSDNARLTSPAPGASFWQTVPPGNGKVAFEVGLVAAPDTLDQYQVSVSGGNLFDGDYFIVRLDEDGTGGTVTLGGAGGGMLVPSQSVPLPGAASEGNRLGMILDTDTGQIDFVTSYAHENLAGAPLVSLPGGAGFGMSLSTAGENSTPGTVEGYTKASDFQLPYPPGTKDTCGNAVTRELVTYPLDASEAEIQALGFDGKLQSALADQRGTYDILDGGVSEELGMAAVSGGAPEVVDISSGSVALEFEASSSSFSPEGPDAGQLYRVSGYVETLVGNLCGAVLYTNQDNTRSLSIIIEGDEVLDIPFMANSARVGVLVNNNTNVIRVWIDGSEQTLTSNTFTAETSAIFLAIAARRQPVDDNGAAGGTGAVRLITDPYWFTTPFPAGSVAIDGVTPADTVAPPAGAAYPLDATEAELQAIGVNSKLDMSEADQKGTLTTFDNAGNSHTWGAGPADLMSAPATASFNGPTAFEVVFDLPDCVDLDGTSSQSQVNAGFFWYTSGFAAQFGLRAEAEKDGTFGLGVVDHAGAANSYAPPTGQFTVGVLLEDGAAFRVWIDDVEQTGLTVNDTAYPASIGLLDAIQSAGLDSGNIGKTASVELVTDASQFTTTFPAGSQDIDGNVFN